MFKDVVIIGAGVTGSAIARELSKYNLDVSVLEKDVDVCTGTSKANSGIVHAGYDALPGTKKAYFNVLGSKQMEKLSKDLDFPYKRNGSIVLCFDEKDIPKLEELKERGLQNGVEGMEILSGDEIRKKEPNLSKDVVAALYVSTGAIVCPFNLTIALAENANMNGVEFNFNSEVCSITKEDDLFHIHTKDSEYITKLIINAAGVYAGKIHNMICEDSIKITARSGEYCLYDKKVGNLVTSTIFQLPSKLGKGVLVTPTVHGNLLVGPNAIDTDNNEKTSTTKEGLDTVQEKASRSIKAVPYRSVITSFAGLRAHPEGNDFIIEESSVEGFIDVAGIESPGLSCAPAIGEYVADLVAKKTNATKKDNFIPYRKGIPSIANATNEEKAKLIKENPLYANVICRCEMVTEGEIVDAIHRPLGATTIDGIKRRTRAGMGRCQAGFCLPKTIEILARELNTDITDITKNGNDSKYVFEHKSN